MKPKGECNLAVTQIQHLHLYKTSSPVCLSGSLSLFLFPSFLSHLLSHALLSFHVLWLEALSFSACFLYTVHSVHVLIAAILGEEENDEEDLFESSRARFCGSAQHGATDTWSA